MGSRIQAIGNTSVQIASRNPHRKYFLVINMSAANIFIKFGDPATTDDVPLYGLGGAWEIPTTTFEAAGVNFKNYEDPLFLDIYAIASVAGPSNLQVVEIA